jgi:hypothetical protein
MKWKIVLIWAAAGRVFVYMAVIGRIPVHRFIVGVVDLLFVTLRYE